MGVCLLAAAAALVMGDLAWLHFAGNRAPQSAELPAWSTAPVEDAGHVVIAEPDGWSSALTFTPEADLQFFPFGTTTQTANEQFALAEGVCTLSDRKPSQFHPPQDATPIVEKLPGDARVNAVLEEELPQASREEREIWRQELDGLPPEVVREILRLRRSLPGAIPRTSFSLPPWTAVPVELPMPGPRAPVPRTAATNDRRDGLQQAGEVVLNNLANMHTCGFRRRIVFLRDAASSTYGVYLPAGAAGLRLDQADGPLQQTGRMLDVAIRGAGFFAIRIGDEVSYTRMGSLVCDEEGRLAIETSVGTGTLEPEVVIAPEVSAVEIGADGTVSVRLEGSEEAVAAGQIELTRFLCPEHLESRDGVLFRPTPQSGPPRQGTPAEDGFGSLQPGALEGSNVSPQREEEDLHLLNQHAEVLEQVRAMLVRPEHGALAR